MAKSISFVSRLSFGYLRQLATAVGAREAVPAAKTWPLLVALRRTGLCRAGACLNAATAVSTPAIGLWVQLAARPAALARGRRSASDAALGGARRTRNPVGLRPKAIPRPSNETPGVFPDSIVRPNWVLGDLVASQLNAWALARSDGRHYGFKQFRGVPIRDVQGFGYDDEIEILWRTRSIGRQPWACAKAARTLGSVPASATVKCTS